VEGGVGDIARRNRDCSSMLRDRFNSKHEFPHIRGSARQLAERPAFYFRMEMLIMRTVRSAGNTW
jgi:hypothetical protein